MRCGRLRIWSYVAAALRRLESQMPTAVLLTSAALFSGCTPAPLEFPDWTIPVPEGTPIIEYAAVPVEERTERIELVEDLVIGQRGDDPNYIFYAPVYMAVDKFGSMYVVDQLDAKVQVFDEHGEYIRTLGKKGQGPGEFNIPIAVAVAGDYIIVHDPTTLRLSVWNSDGRHLKDRIMTMTRTIDRPMFGTEDGAFIAHYSQRVTEPSSSSLQIVARFSIDGAEVLRLGELKEPPKLTIHTGPVSYTSSSNDMAGVPGYAATPAGLTYLTAGDEYQVLALDAQGLARWALRVAWERVPISEEDKENRIRRLRKVPTQIDTSRTEWPEAFGAISRLCLDGHGKLYVFPQVSSVQRPGEYVPVDVFSPDGEHLFSGLMEPFEWTAASGDFVYGIRENQETGEREPVRYRLVEPFRITSGRSSSAPHDARTFS